MQELYDWVLNEFNSIPKIILIFTGLVTFMIRLRNQFSRTKEKNELKQDLEILELARKNGLSTTDLENSIRKKMEKSFIGESALSNFLIGMFLILFFSLWSISIYESNDGFTPAMGWTILFALLGLSIFIGDERKLKEKDVFFTIEITGKTNFIFGLVLFLFTGIVGALLIIRDGEISFWFIMCLFFFFGGIRNIIQAISINK
jgi:hypothetical protein